MRLLARPQYEHEDILLGGVAILLALAKVFSTGILYAYLRTIRQWNTSLVPMNVILLGLASGGV